jgi:hypothetical protein
MDLNIENVQTLGDFTRMLIGSFKDLGFGCLSEIFFSKVLQNYEKKLKNSQQSE